MSRLFFRAFPLIPLTFVLAVAQAQPSALVDEGTFQVSRNGTPIGREAFSIVRSPAPGGQVYLAKGTSAIGERTLTTALGTDSLGVPVTYESLLREGGAMAEQTQGRGRPGRFSVLVQTRSGEAAREYVLNNGAVLLDGNVFHQLYFVALAGPHENYLVVTPGDAKPGRLRYEARPAEPVEIAGRRIVARRYALVDATGDRYVVSVDSSGRILRVAAPDRGLVALRDDPPR